jgi:exonuclease SbcD
MKFAHIADCHIGSWRNPKLRDVSTRVFVKTVDKCIEQGVDFLLIAGDLFHTALPGIELLKDVTVALKKLKDNGIGVYLIAGSHDFSASGKTMISVLESAGLLINVVKKIGVVDGKLKLGFTVDPKTGVKIVGMLGKKGMLDKVYYENLLHDNLVAESGYKIFMFHTALTEFKPKEMADMESQPLSLLPKGFNYYAGGHVHYIFDKEVEGYGRIVYPGALFPANFAELEKFGNGGFCLVSEDSFEWVPVSVFNTFNIKVDCKRRTPVEVKEEILNLIKDKEFNNTIVTIRVFGCLESGKISDIDFGNIFEELYSRSAYFVMKNTSGIRTSEFEEIVVDVSDVDKIEQKIVGEHLGQVKVFEGFNEKEVVDKMLGVLANGKNEGETIINYETRIKKELEGILW